MLFFLRDCYNKYWKFISPYPGRPLYTWEEFDIDDIITESLKNHLTLKEIVMSAKR